jgi:hypothetical protein
MPRLLRPRREAPPRVWAGRGAEWRGVPPRTTARLWNALRRATWRHAVELRSAVHGHELLSLRRQTRRRENGPFSPAFRGRGGGHSYTKFPLCTSVGRRRV